MLGPHSVGTETHCPVVGRQCEAQRRGCMRTWLGLPAASPGKWKRARVVPHGSGCSHCRHASFCLLARSFALWGQAFCPGSSLVLTPGIHLPGPSAEVAPFHLLAVLAVLGAVHDVSPSVAFLCSFLKFKSTSFNNITLLFVCACMELGIVSALGAWMPSQEPSVPAERPVHWERTEQAVGPAGAWAQVRRHWRGHQIFADLQGGHLERQGR